MSLPIDHNFLSFDSSDGWRASDFESNERVCRCTCMVCGLLKEIYDDDDSGHHYDDNDDLAGCDGHWNPVCSLECYQLHRMHPYLRVSEGL